MYKILLILLMGAWCISHVSFLAFASVNPLEFSALRALSELIKDVLLVTGPDSGFGTS